MKLVILYTLGMFLLACMIILAQAQQPQPQPQMTQDQAQLEVVKASRDFNERFAAQIITSMDQQLKQCQGELAALKNPPKPDGSQPKGESK